MGEEANENTVHRQHRTCNGSPQGGEYADATSLVGSPLKDATWACHPPPSRPFPTFSTHTHIYIFLMNSTHKYLFFGEYTHIFVCLFVLEYVF